MRLRKYGAGAIVASVLTAGLAVPSGAQAVARPNPLLFVHGFTSSSAVWKSKVTGRDSYAEWLAYEYSGTKPVYVDYAQGTGNAAVAEDIKQKVDTMYGANNKRVDIVTHSMGALSARYAVKNLGISGKVKSVVSLAGPNHGVAACNFGQIAPNAIECKEMAKGSTFLTDLGATDETPGSAITYLTVRLEDPKPLRPTETVSCDLVVPFGTPLSRTVRATDPIVFTNATPASPVPGAAVNIKMPCQKFNNVVDGIEAHRQMPRDKRVYDKVMDFLDGKAVNSGV